MSDSFTQDKAIQNIKQSTSTRYQSPFLKSQPNDPTDQSMTTNNNEFEDQNEFNDIFSQSQQNIILSQYSGMNFNSLQKPQQKFMYISAISKNRDNILPKNCSATYKGQEQFMSKYQRKLSTQLQFQTKKAVKSSKVEMLRKSEMLVRELDDLNQNQFKKLNEIKHRKSRLSALSPGQSLINNLAEVDQRTADRIKSQLSQMKINVGTDSEETPKKTNVMSRRKMMTKSSTPKIQEEFMAINYLRKPSNGQNQFLSQPSSSKNNTLMQVQASNRNTKQLYQSLLAFEQLGSSDILNQSSFKLPQTQMKNHQNMSILSPVSSRKNNRSQILNKSSKNLFSKTSILMSPKENMSLEGSLQAFGQNETLLALQKFRKADANNVFEGVVLQSEQNEHSPKNKKTQNVKKLISPRGKKKSQISKLNSKKLGLSSKSNTRSSDIGIFSQSHAFCQEPLTPISPTPGLQSQDIAKPATPHQQSSPRFHVRDNDDHPTPPMFDLNAVQAIFPKGSRQNFQQNAAIEVTTEDLDVQDDLIDSPVFPQSLPESPGFPQKVPRKTAHFESPLNKEAIHRRASQAVGLDGPFGDLAQNNTDFDDRQFVGITTAYRQTGLAQTQPLRIPGSKSSPKKLRIEKLQSKMKKLSQQEGLQAPPTLREAKQKTPRRVSQPAVKDQIDSSRKTKNQQQSRKSPRYQELQVEELTFREQDVTKKNFSHLKNIQVQKCNQANFIDETFEDMHKNAMSMIAYQGLSQKVMKANEGGKMQLDTFQELGIGDRYKELLDENIKYRAARRKRIAAAQRAASQSQGSQGSPRLYLEASDLEPEEILFAAWIDDVDCMSKLKFLNKQAKVLKHNLSLALRPIYMPDFHENIVSSPPDTAPKGHKFELVENVPVNCRIKVKGLYGPLKILCEVDIDEQQRQAQQQFIQNQIKQNTRKASPKKKTKDSSKSVVQNQNLADEGGDAQGKATFITAPILSDQENKERDLSPETEENPKQKISLSQKKKMEKFKFSHDLTVFASINPQNADPQVAKNDLQVDCKHQEKFFFKFGNQNNPDNIMLPFVDELFQEEYVYLTFLSETGCKVVVKAQFSEKVEVRGKEKGGGGAMFGDAAKEEEVGLAAVKAARLAEIEAAKRAVRCVKELQDYYKEQTKPPEGINDNFVGTNKVKYCDLQLLQQEREQYELLMRFKQLEAQHRKHTFDNLQRQAAKHYLAHWDEYRAVKFELVKDYCRVLKRQKRLKEFASHQVLCFIIHNFSRYFNEQKLKRRQHLRTIFLTIKINQRYRFKYCRPYGVDIKFRTRQELRRRLLVWPTMMLTSETIQDRAKSVIKAFIYDFLPALKIVSGFGRYKKSVQCIEQTRKKMLFSRIYKNQYFEKVFEREIKFLTEFFEKGKAKNKNIQRGLKKINEEKLSEAIQNYQRKLICDYLLLTRADNISKLKVRIKINQTVLAEHYTAKAYEQATGKKYKGQCCNQIHSSFEENLKRDEQLLKKLYQREKQLAIESYAIEEALFSGESSQLVYDYETHVKSFESYQAKIQAKVKKTTKKIKKGMQDLFRDALVKKKVSNQDIPLDQDEREQNDGNQLVQKLNQLGMKNSSQKLNLNAKRNSSKNLEVPDREPKRSSKKGARNKNAQIVEDVKSPVQQVEVKENDDNDSDIDEQIKCERRIGPDAIKISREDIHRILLKYSINGLIDIDGVINETRQQNEGTHQSIDTDY